MTGVLVRREWDTNTQREGPVNAGQTAGCEPGGASEAGSPSADSAV